MSLVKAKFVCPSTKTASLPNDSFVRKKKYLIYLSEYVFVRPTKQI